MKRNLLLLLAFYCLNLSAQTNRIDSLQRCLTQQTDTQYVNTLNALSDAYMLNGSYQEAFQKAKLSCQKAKQIGFVDGELNAMLLIGSSYCNLFNYAKSISIYKEVLQRAEQNNKSLVIARVYLSMGYTYEYLQKYSLAFSYYAKANRLAEKLGNLDVQARSLNNIAVLYKDEDKLDLALEFYQKSLRLKLKINDVQAIGNAYHNIAHVYKLMEKYDESDKYYKKAIHYRKLAGDKNGLAFSYVNYGVFFDDIGEHEKAKGYLQKGYGLYRETQNYFEICRALTAIAVNLYYTNNLKAAIDTSRSAAAIAKRYKFPERLRDSYQMLTVLYQNQKNFELAFENYAHYVELKDSLSGVDEAKEMQRLQVLFNAEKKQQEIKILNREAKIIRLQGHKDKMWIGFLTVSALLLALSAVLLFNRFRTNQKAKKILEQQNEEISHQKKEITDSINYAKRIQESILPPEAFWKNALPNSFILYRPKDIVSGDFYWLDKKGSTVFFSAVDCTGHGVPGAMMSVVGFNLLSAAVNEAGLKKPSDILSFLDEGVTKTLRQSQDGVGVKDGMDLALCTFDTDSLELNYAGAFNSLYHCSDGVLNEIKADKFPIGINLDGVVDHYTNHALQLKKGDCVYIFSDGYADQFGGPNGKKFKYSHFKEILLNNYQLPIEEQKAKLLEVFDKWKNDLEQVDDVLVIGLQV